MPGLVVHTVLAATVLDRWRQSPASAPFDPRDPEAAGAFFKGAMAPDMGYYPSGVARVSDLVHASGSADVARALLGAAETGPQRAFAWGWVSHVLADVVLHPVINRVGGQIVHLANGGSLHPGQNPAIHLRVELGLDAHLFPRHEKLLRAVWTRCPETPAPVHLVEALRAVYPGALSAAELVRSETALTRVAPLQLNLISLLASTSRIARRGGWISSVLRARWRDAPEVASRASLLQALCSPLQPPSLLLQRTLRTIRRFPSALRFHLLTALTRLGDHDLDTGVCLDTAPGIAADRAVTVAA